MRKEFGICIAVLCDTNTSVKIYLLTYLLTYLWYLLADML